MSGSRFGEETPPPERRERVYRQDDGWWFTTREGRPMGPYDTESDARAGLADFIEFIGLAPLDTLASLTDALTPEDQGSGEAPAGVLGYPDGLDGNVTRVPKPSDSDGGGYAGGDSTGLDD